MGKEQYDAITKIASVDGSGEAQGATSITKALSAEKQAEFEHFLNQRNLSTDQTAAQAKDANKTQLQSLYDPNAEIGATNPAFSKQQIIAQADQINTRIEAIKEALASSDATIKPGYKNKLSNRLDHINESLKIAVEKTGSEIETPATATPTLLNPIQKFLGQMTHAQFQMESIRNYLASVNEDVNKLTPANMMAIQMKVYGVQQEIELFTNMLNKALESTKTIMNVQV